jgi:UDP-N-acetyl-2-amino-2-deoxyglucuronate dehydrogenase
MISIAFLGVGRVFEGRLIDVFRDEIANLRVEVVCDRDLEKAKRVAKIFGAKFVTESSKKFWDRDFDVVYIATESGNHFEHAREALEAGKHVIVEKPPALLPEQVSYLVLESQKRRLMYAVILQNRFNPAMVKLKEAYDDGRFGEIALATIRLRWCREQAYYEDGWHGTWMMDGGVVNQQAFHHVDALQWVCGPIDRVVAIQSNAVNKLEAEDTMVASVQFAHGALGVIEVTTAARPKDLEASLSVVGEKGLAVVGGIALNNIEMWEFVNQQSDDKTIPKNFSQDVPTGYGLSHGIQIQEIIDRLSAGSIKPPIGGEDALPALELVHALYRSVETNGWVSLKENPRSERLGQ